MNTYDIDGVIYINKDLKGVSPSEDDFIITGRSIEETKVTLEMLHSRGIFNQVFFNHLSFKDKTRVSSGIHKGNTIKMLIESGYKIGCHFEDDPIQIQEIKKIVPDLLVIHVDSPTEKENVKHEFNLKEDIFKRIL